MELIVLTNVSIFFCDWKQSTGLEKERREKKPLKVNEQLAGLPRQTASLIKFKNAIFEIFIGKSWERLKYNMMF